MLSSRFPWRGKHRPSLTLSLAINLALLLILLSATVRRLQRAYPPMDQELNADAYLTYLPNARKLLEAPWAFLTTDPRSYDVAPLTYIWPAILGADRASVQFANGVLFLVALLLFWSFVRRLGGALAAFVAAGMLITHPEIVGYAPQVLTEAQYFFGLTIALYAALRAYTSSKYQKWWLALMVVGLDITLLTRPILKYILLLGIASLGAALWVNRESVTDERLRIRSWTIALICSLVLPSAIAIKNGVYFGVWGLGTGVGTGLYYGVSPFKNGSDPAFSNFSFDAGVAPRLVDATTEGHPLDKWSDEINRIIAIETIKQTSIHDNIRFFAFKLKNWLITSTPELVINDNFRRYRIFEWLCIGMVSSILLTRKLSGHELLLPGAKTSGRQKVTVYLFLLGIVFIMAVQLTPLLYNSRYASYFIEPWLMVLTGLSVSYFIQGGARRTGSRRYAALISRVTVVLLLGYAAHELTEHAKRREAWRLDPYRPGPTLPVLGSNQFSAPVGDGMTLRSDGQWEFTQEPSTMRIQLDSTGHPLYRHDPHDAMWRIRFALMVPGESPPSRCGKILFSVAPHEEDLLWYTPPAWIYASRSPDPTTYMLAANGAWRPTAGISEISLTFNCPVGSTLRWYGMEMRRVSVAEAARDLIEHGTPMNPYLRTEP